MDYELFGLSRTEWIYYIDEYVFNERDRMILKRRLLDGITYERLAEEFDMSVKQMENIVKKQEIRIFVIIQKKRN